MIKLVRRNAAGVKFTSDRLLESVQRAFNNTVRDRVVRRDGFGKSSFIDEWFDYNTTVEGMDYWSMANHLFLVGEE